MVTADAEPEAHPALSMGKTGGPSAMRFAWEVEARHYPTRMRSRSGKQHGEEWSPEGGDGIPGPPDEKGCRRRLARRGA
eukprot:8789353-Pyramimonas_sp.AAC.1